MMRTKPTPARTRSLASTVPSAPQPQRVTRLARSAPARPCRCRGSASGGSSVRGIGVDGHGEWCASVADARGCRLRDSRRLTTDSVVFQERLQEPRPTASATSRSLANPTRVSMSSRGPPQLRPVESLQVGGQVLHRLARRRRVDDRRVRAVEEHVGVQHRQQQRVDAEFRRDQREHRGPVGHFVGFVGQSSAMISPRPRRG